ncbi:putative membrane protein [Saonia flava]|uniref:Putative membrane protein n=1 Tax=Saonia flava TaxID=523696 RepID=A0A846QW61_9FLAO|nr:SdpI family protein [Saonia flava]NJB71170.1 putative membrane protein [Saonia flava]
MRTTLKKELPIIIILILPFIYLAYVWNSLPERVPMHWNINGDVDRWGDKMELVSLPFLLPVLVYIIFLFVPKIDPKKKIQKMGNKFQQLKFILVLFMSALAILIIYSAKNQSFTNINYVFVLIGLLITTLGNYFKTLQPNYFIGIRTPWTLENETVWNDTHKLGGVLWFVGGLLMIISCFLLKGTALMSVFFGTVAVIIIVPLVYSYLKFKSLKE